MSSSLPSDILAEMKGRDRVFSVFELDLSSTLRFAEKNNIGEGSLGLYSGYIQSASLPTRTANVTEYTLSAQRGTIAVKDVGRALQKEHGGPFSLGVEGVAARWKLIAPGCAPYTLHDMVVTNWGISDDVFTYEVAPRTQEFDGTFNLPIASRDLFPNIPASKADVDIGLVYGGHKSSANSGSSGMLPAIPIGEASIWVFAVGACQGVDAVYVNGEVAPAGTWDLFVLARASHLFSGVVFATPPPDVEDDVVTIDARGLTDSPDGSGTLIENPIAIARHVVANFVYSNGYTAGLETWADEATLPIATSILDG